ncbi:PREDICTED: citron Rho-interacting kinase-like, partial [Priapulus caudatus]|uniref:Citron Rho-interacting kinase-like n=1 Tax=Priapulus caudatus TaxID=37621 RepID=A0ABM1ELE5_PRICU
MSPRPPFLIEAGADAAITSILIFQDQHHVEQVKLQGTIDQQMKLIDFLQAKIENPSKKKKKGLFGGGGGSKKQPAQKFPMQWRDLEAMLERERGVNRKLTEQLNQMQKQVIHQRKQAGATLPSSGGATTQPAKVALSSIVEPQMERMTLLRASAGARQPRGGATARCDIPHRFVSALNTRAATCAACLDTIHLGRQASRCAECHLSCHPKCATNLPSTCGLPSEYLDHVTKSPFATVTPSPGVPSSDKSVRLEGWLKIQGVKSAWDRSYVVVRGATLSVHDKENAATRGAGDAFDLAPADGVVVVHEAVGSSELPTAAASDVPYILRVEFRPHTTCWPARNLYLMTPNFLEKNKWACALASVVAAHASPAPDALLRGNVVTSLTTSDRKLDVNCTLVLNDQLLLLLGAEEGLFALPLPADPSGGALYRVEGIDKVYQMLPLTQLGLIVMITGKHQELCTIEAAPLASRVARASVAAPTVTPAFVSSIATCHLIAGAWREGCGFVCAALPDKLKLLKYCATTCEFVVLKEFATAEPCSCLLFTEHSVILGTNTYYEIDLMQGTIEDFLDASDTSLAYVVYAAAGRSSFPVSVMQVSPPGKEEEFLLCFHEFGVFVDAYGCRSRKDDMKWSRLPLAFGYSAPYLFITHINCVEVCDINKRTSSSSGGATVAQAYFPVTRPRYLGEAGSPGAIYVASCRPGGAELVCLRGN